MQPYLLMKQKSLTVAEKKFLKKLGARLRALRTAKGWTLEDVEEHGWKSWQHLQKIESGKNITIVTVRKIAALYKIPLSKLLVGI